MIELGRYFTRNKYEFIFKRNVSDIHGNGKFDI